MYINYSEEHPYFSLDSQRDLGSGKCWKYCSIVNSTNLSKSRMSLALDKTRLRERIELASWSALYKEC